jgi:hypothetical protein
LCIVYPDPLVFSQSKEVDHSANDAPWGPQDQMVALRHRSSGLDQDPDTGGVEERQAGEIEHEIAVVVYQGEPGLEGGGGSCIELAGQP